MAIFTRTVSPSCIPSTLRTFLLMHNRYPACLCGNKDVAHVVLPTVTFTLTKPFVYTARIFSDKDFSKVTKYQPPSPGHRHTSDTIVKFFFKLGMLLFITCSHHIQIQVLYFFASPGCST